MIRFIIKLSKLKLESNYGIVKNIIKMRPGLRFHEIKKETNLANGTLQHHINRLVKTKAIKATYDKTIPRYFIDEFDELTETMIKRLNQKTPSKIIKSLLKSECLTFSQIVNFAKKSPGTVSIYKNMLLEDNIIIGDTSTCDSCSESINKIKYRLIDHKRIRIIVEEYGKTSLKKSADNLADVFLAIK